ncbi:putative PurR-regulated permease PerM [Rhodopirellula rubra]|uniref:Putative PurR-regulated permease PerM n=1 Tax=Aporhodopirellula rubra TaxID=980271 RepID=A0A7W5E3J1_9BACT|nr:AI-2E family transporter [Aporhodopirellula rubra]MBB3209187.1 putative PurR-regulated permease PerM [Aporhodopirellula rubra]
MSGAPHDERSNDGSLVASTLTIAWSIVGVVAALALVIVARHVFILIFGAILFAVVLNRIASKLLAWVPIRWSRSIMVGIVLILLVVLLIAAVFGLAGSIVDQLDSLTTQLTDSVSRVREAAQSHPLWKRVQKSDVGLSSLLPSSGSSMGIAQTFFSSTFGIATDVLILSVLTVYFAISPSAYRKPLIRLAPVPWRERLDEMLRRSSTTLWHWMLGQAVSMTAVGIAFGVGLWFLDVPMAIQLGLFAGLVTFVPTIGGIAAVVPAMLLASGEGASNVWSVLALYAVVQFAESYLLTPMVQKQQVNLPPAMVILSQVIIGLLLGFWGVVFATPLFAVAILWVKELYVKDWLEKADEVAAPASPSASG